MDLVTLFIGADELSTTIAIDQLEGNGIPSLPITKGKIPYKTGLKVKREDYERAMELIRDLDLIDSKYLY